MDLSKLVSIKKQPFLKGKPEAKEAPPVKKKSKVPPKPYQLLLLTYTPIPEIPKRCQTPRVLTLLGVPHKTNKDFWIVNEQQLEYIYNDFIRESKKLKCRLHPQNGGDPEVFMRFNSLCVMAANSFRTHGIGPRSAINAVFEREDAIVRMKATNKFKYDLKHSARH